MLGSQSNGSRWPPEIRLDRERVLRLLTGDRFYSNASASLREAVLNAIDATYRRGQAEPGHEPEIEVVFDRENLTVSVSDNGDGMNQDSMGTLFATIGASAAEFDPYGKGEVGEFGIGVVSYFMAADVFEVETYNGKDEPIALRFKKDMFVAGQADELEARRDEQGTIVRLTINGPETFDLLLRQYPHWCRNVRGLRAKEEPSGRELRQGGAVATFVPVAVTLPEGIEHAHIGPLSSESAWDIMTGASVLAILYRGVYVQDFTVEGIWGIQGSVHVDPKAFKPRLDREGFIGSELRDVIANFARTAHPVVLTQLAELIRGAFRTGSVGKWSEKRFATLWLSVPRTEPYKDAADTWDNVFRGLPAFELYRSGKWTPATVQDLLKVPGPIWIAPQHSEVRKNDLVKSAERLLRETGSPVLRGITRDNSWLKGANNYFATTADLIVHVFAAELPEMKPIVPSAASILDGLKPIHTLYNGEEPVEIVELGSDGPPVLRVGKRLLLNCEVSAGISIIKYALQANRGRGALVEATAVFAPQYLGQAAKVAKKLSGPSEILGLVKRHYLTALLP